MLDMLFFWIGVFIISLFFLVKGADYLIENAERIGLSWGLSPFVIGVVIIGIGTSLPELVTSITAVLRGVSEIVVANGVGSNIANILVVLGVTAIFTKNLAVEKNLIYLDLPILIMGTILFLGVALGREVLDSGLSAFVINKGEAIFLITVYIVYLGYSFLHQDNDYVKKLRERVQSSDVNIYNYLLLVTGLIGVIIGAKYVVDATLEISKILDIGSGVIALLAIAIGTSLPELFVSFRAAHQGKPEIAVGNIFGSSMFNMLMLIGIPGLFSTLIIDEITYTVGLPTLFAATLVFVISGISNKVHRWDGAMYLMLYILFVAKTLALF